MRNLHMHVCCCVIHSGSLLGLDRMAYFWENAAFLCVLSTLQAVSLPWQIDCKGEMLIFSVCGPLSRQSSLTRQIGCKRESVEFIMVCSLGVSLDRYIYWLWVDCKHSRSAVCLPAGSWGTPEMHGLIEMPSFPDADTLAGYVFRATSQHLETLPGQSVCLSGSISLCQCRGSSQWGWLFYWLVGEALTFPPCSFVYAATHCLPSSPQVYHCRYMML